MDISINISGVQEDKKYLLEFCISQDGEIVRKTSSPQKKKFGPSLEDFEKKEEKNVPKLEDPKINIKKDIKVESSFEGKINPTK